MLNIFVFLLNGSSIWTVIDRELFSPQYQSTGTGKLSVSDHNNHCPLLSAFPRLAELQLGAAVSFCIFIGTLYCSSVARQHCTASKTGSTGCLQIDTGDRKQARTGPETPGSKQRKTITFHFIWCPFGFCT